MNEKPLKISEISSKIKELLENSFISVYITGEISNYKYHSSGHHYFSLKDENAQISCVIWRSRPVRFNLEDGMKVIARGSLTVYPPQGKYQIEIVEIVPEGRGDLYIAFEKLKAKLEEKGYFDNSRKRRLPEIPLSVGVATSPTGAAIQDIISTIKRRFPIVQIYFRPTLVQGDGSAEDVVRAINELEKYKPDAIIIGRGGGSIEDLWSFNTEMVADAIFNCSVPIVSAVGHETDFTIADFVADLRAATPTAAAELVTPHSLDELSVVINNYDEQMQNLIKSNISIIRNNLENIYSNNFYRRLNERIHFYNQRIDDSQSQIEYILQNNIKVEKNKLNSLSFSLESLHPNKPLDKGYALIKHKNKYLKITEAPILNQELEIIRKYDKTKVKVLSNTQSIF
ncbi:MAG: exodeoxyribonuclease VII large subunit [Candidatus Kapaibacteriota bacterium]